MIYSCIEGKNDKLIKGVAKLYFKEKDKIIDLTYGRGNFWNLIDTSIYDFYSNDIKKGLANYQEDMRCTTWPDKFFNIVIIDPPYTVRQGRYEMNDRYGLDKIENVQQIYDLYQRGILEARRILKKGGLLLIKTQNMTHGGKAYWIADDIKSHCKINQLGLIEEFVLKNNQVVKKYKQKTARKNHSYLLIFKKKGW